MKENVVIEVKDISKTFRVYRDKNTTLMESILFRKRNRYERRMVLDSISFSVKRGEAIGLIGHNGCGKSTLLKILTKILYPDNGSVEINGRISSLLELGAGFHPDMSGRENIYINASIFGLTRKEIDEKIDEIIDFSELRQFIDNPVRTYSSGMYMRLAFSVAISVNADILLVDEILAVGDVTFQNKCIDTMRSLIAKGVTVVIVSHSTGQIAQLCNRVIWLNNGKIIGDGKPRELIPQYLEYMQEKEELSEEKQEVCGEREELNEKKQEICEEREELNQEKQEICEEKECEIKETEQLSSNNEEEIREKEIPEVKNRYGNRHIRIETITLMDAVGKKRKTFRTGEYLKICVGYRVKKKVEDVVFGIGIWNEQGINCYGTNTLIDLHGACAIEKDGCIEIEIPELNLLAGDYTLQLAFTNAEMLPIDYWNDAYFFKVTNYVGDIGICRIDHRWKGDLVDELEKKT